MKKAYIQPKSFLMTHTLHKQSNGLLYDRFSEKIINLKNNAKVMNLLNTILFS
jgi:hypothetical protein